LVSTTLGLALGGESSRHGKTPNDQDGKPGAPPHQAPGVPTVGILGDLALLHDVNGLQAVRSAGVPVVFVVVNNDGGGIFQTLPVKDYEPVFTTFFSTPHGMSFEAAAALHGIGYARAENVEELGNHLALMLNSGTSALLEIKTDKEITHARRKAIVEAVVSAMDELWMG
jgi:2-succinyl-5-enolpyruvyl-6-hydroxy-3-cyclohexene-1-carboxylate synthase